MSLAVANFRHHTIPNVHKVRHRQKRASPFRSTDQAGDAIGFSSQNPPHAASAISKTVLVGRLASPALVDGTLRSIADDLIANELLAVKGGRPGVGPDAAARLLELELGR